MPEDPPESRYRIFVGAFPVEPLAGQLQAVRNRYDPQTAQITPPHVTLAGTYWRSGPATPENESQTIRALQGRIGQLAPFDLLLGGVSAFRKPRPVVYLNVALTAHLIAVREILLLILGKDQHRLFAPHLTLAMRLGPHQAGEMLAALKTSQWHTARWTEPVRELCLMQRGLNDPAWRCIAVFPFLNT